MSLSMRFAALSASYSARRAQKNSGSAGTVPHTNPEPPHTLRQHNAVSIRNIGEFQVYSVAPMAFADSTANSTQEQPDRRESPQPSHVTNHLDELAPQQAATHACLYLHPGGFTNTIKPKSWHFIDHIAGAGIRVEIPIYGLLPTFTAAEAIPFIQDSYRELVRDHGTENVSILADSAGGSLALGALTPIVDANPSSLILNAPWVDMDLANPAIPDIEQRDPVLNAAALRRAGALWSASIEGGTSSPVVSPIEMASSTLETWCGTTVRMYCGDRDLSLPDARAMTSTLRSAGVDAELKVVPGGIHMYHLAKTAEGRRDRAEMIELMTGKDQR